MALTVSTVPTKPFEGQKPGTSGLRKKASPVFLLFLLENFSYSFETVAYLLMIVIFDIIMWWFCSLIIQVRLWAFDIDFQKYFQVKVFLEPNYTENFIQCILNSNLSSIGGSTLVVGGDGRYFCKEATELIIRICAANGVSTLVGYYTMSLQTSDRKIWPPNLIKSNI